MENNYDVVGEEGKQENDMQTADHDEHCIDPTTLKLYSFYHLKSGKLQTWY